MGEWINVKPRFKDGLQHKKLLCYFNKLYSDFSVFQNGAILILTDLYLPNLVEQRYWKSKQLKEQ